MVVVHLPQGHGQAFPRGVARIVVEHEHAAGAQLVAQQPLYFRDQRLPDRRNRLPLLAPSTNVKPLRSSVNSASRPRALHCARCADRRFRSTAARRGSQAASSHQRHRVRASDRAVGLGLQVSWSEADYVPPSGRVGPRFRILFPQRRLCGSLSSPARSGSHRARLACKRRTRPPLEKADSPDVLSARCRRRNLVNTPIDFAPRCAMLTPVGPPIKT